MVSSSRLCRHFGSLLTVEFVMLRRRRIIGPYTPVISVETEPPGGSLSSVLLKSYGPMIRMLRGITNKGLNKEPKWHHNRPELTSGYEPRWGNR